MASLRLSNKHKNSANAQFYKGSSYPKESQVYSPSATEYWKGLELSFCGVRLKGFRGFRFKASAIGL